MITGCMFAGKTTRLIELARRAGTVRSFKPVLDDRYGTGAIVSHDGESLECLPVHSSRDILDHLEEDRATTVIIDEAQFFDHELPGTVSVLREMGLSLIVAGLDLDSSGRPFGPIPDLVALADVNEGLFAECSRCGGPANRSYRRPSEATGQIAIGGADLYEPRCEPCLPA